MTGEESITLTIELDPKTGQRLEAVVARFGRSLGELVREALQEYGGALMYGQTGKLRQSL